MLAGRCALVGSLSISIYDGQKGLTLGSWARKQRILNKTSVVSTILIKKVRMEHNYRTSPPAHNLDSYSRIGIAFDEMHQGYHQWGSKSEQIKCPIQQNLLGKYVYVFQFQYIMSANLKVQSSPVGERSFVQYKYCIGAFLRWEYWTEQAKSILRKCKLVMISSFFKVEKKSCYNYVLHISLPEIHQLFLHPTSSNSEI